MGATKGKQRLKQKEHLQQAPRIIHQSLNYIFFTLLNLIFLTMELYNIIQHRFPFFFNISFKQNIPTGWPGALLTKLFSQTMVGPDKFDFVATSLIRLICLGIKSFSLAFSLVESPQIWLLHWLIWEGVNAAIAVRATNLAQPNTLT